MTGALTAPPGELAGVCAEVFGDRLPLAIRYAQILAGDGIAQGLIGPREADRLWERHLLNCAVVSELLPVGAAVTDIGSGAGLPGLVLSCVRADLQVRLVEPMQRRVDFLNRTVAELGLTDSVDVVRGRAESREVKAVVTGAGWVTARAVAPLDRLATWCLPLLARDGRLLAMKGAQAAEEVAVHRGAVGRLGGEIEDVVVCAEGRISPPTTVVVVRKVR